MPLPPPCPQIPDSYGPPLLIHPCCLPPLTHSSLLPAPPYPLPLYQTPGSYGPPVGWKGLTPTNGHASFDFVSVTPPPEDAEALSEEQFLDFLHAKVSWAGTAGPAGV